ncbi:MAG: nucleotide exchange factor GrpE [Verrucomicrobiota bacterium]|jgi:molecular chaperone GrpE
MSNNENNLGMAGESGVNESPLPEGSAGAPGVGDIEGASPEDAPVSPEELSELKAKAAKADENWDKYVRLTADFDNFKKRAARDRSEAIKYANEALLEKLLPVADNFEAALTAANNSTNTNVDSLKTGVNMILTQFKNFLADNGVEEIDALGKPFDPNLHEAVSQQESDEAPEGQVIQQMRKGYKFRDRLLRPAMVVVAK